ncbi:MAG: hypothetical protein HRU01_08765, partial [Myxococcales bacterium]|nr:hypothetical protein [Myxococcales bacterium]
MRRWELGIAVVAAWGIGCGARVEPEIPRAGAPKAAPVVRRVDDARLRAAADEPQSWLTHGGTYAEQRYSQL